MATVKFVRGLYSAYQPETMADVIFFATDHKAIYMGGVKYTGIEKEETRAVADIQLNASKNALVISYTVGDPKTVDLEEFAVATKDKNGFMAKEDKAELDRLSVEYDDYASGLGDEIAMTSSVGGINRGTTVAQLKAKTISQIFDDLLFPTVNPSVGAPSASISMKGATVREVNSTAPITSDFTVTGNRGSIMLGGKEQAKTAGKISATKVTYGGNTQLPEKVKEGTMTYTGTVTFGAGAQPKDSKGNNYSSPYAGGDKTDTTSITGVYPYYANKDNCEAFVKLSLTTASSLNAIKFASEGPAKHAFKLPSKYTLTGVTKLNTMSGKYEAFGTAKWDVTTEMIDVNGVQVEYKVYTRNDAGFSGEATFNITFSK